MKAQKHTIQHFNRQFPDNAACLDWLFQTRFGAAKCPKCRRTGQYHRQEDTSHYVCTCGGHQLSPKKDTIFEKSSTDLHSWFFAMFLMANAKNGVAAKEIERQVGVTYKTAWRMARLIRMLMEQGPVTFGGTVEADETYVGSRRGGIRMKGRGTKKTPVVGVVERGGGLFAKATADVCRSTVMRIVKDHVEPGSRLMTDEFAGYATASSSFAMRPWRTAGRNMSVARPTRTPSKGSGPRSNAGFPGRITP